MKNSGLSGISKVSAFYELLCQTESEVLLSPLLLIHANRYLQAQKIKNKDKNRK